ncbi:hypothetical protein GCM10010129_78900 [Streptomyces fumigatiscleroticus]|nr:hypothetical protein GCM10010129_78900 [Streptomyces fumigatiscleroticus]
MTWCTVASRPSSLDDVTWLVTPPSGTASGTYPLTATATYSGGSCTADATLLVPFASVKAAYTNVGITDDSDPAPGKYDGGGFSFSAQALAAEGLEPGTSFTHDGLTCQWPDVEAGTPDAIGTKGQAVLISGTGSELGIVGSGTSGPAQGIGTIVYTDGSAQQYGLSFSDWWDNSNVAQGGSRLGTYAYINSDDGKVDQKVSLFATKVQLAAGKTAQAVVLPTSGEAGTPQGHVFTMAIGGTSHTPAPQPDGPTGHLTGQGDKCVDLAADPAAGVQAVLATCDDDASQQWTLGADDTVWNQGKCLATAEGGTTNGTDVVLDYCDGSKGQRWTVDSANSYLVNAASGLCLENSNGSTADGNPLIIWTCNSGDAGQRWKVPSDAVSSPSGRIAGYDGKCAEVAGGATADGTAVQLNACGSGVQQVWTVAADGTLRALGKCMTVAGGATADGTPVQLSACTGAASQRWTSDAKGQLVGAGSGKCLDATGPSSANGTKLQIWTCAASANQLWKLPARSGPQTDAGPGGTCSHRARAMSSSFGSPPQDAPRPCRNVSTTTSAACPGVRCACWCEARCTSSGRSGPAHPGGWSRRRRPSSVARRRKASTWAIQASRRRRMASSASMRARSTGQVRFTMMMFST